MPGTPPTDSWTGRVQARSTDLARDSPAPRGSRRELHPRLAFECGERHSHHTAPSASRTQRTMRCLNREASGTPWTSARRPQTASVSVILWRIRSRGNRAACRPVRESCYARSAAGEHDPDWTVPTSRTPNAQARWPPNRRLKLTGAPPGGRYECLVGSMTRSLTRRCGWCTFAPAA